jgi:hypothetical protein
MMRGPVRELVPVGVQKVRLRLPEGKQAKTVRLLAAGKVVDAEQVGRHVTVTVPSVLDHEVVAVDV